MDALILELTVKPKYYILFNCFFSLSLYLSNSISLTLRLTVFLLPSLFSINLTVFLLIVRISLLFFTLVPLWISLYFVAVVVVWVGPMLFGSVVWLKSWASSEIDEAATATVTMRHLVVFLLGFDASATIGQVLLFGPMLWKCFC